MHAAARAFEAGWGLIPMSPLDRTARRRPVTGEAEKAARCGLDETAREVLQRTVRTVAALARGDTDFLERLRDAGLRVRERHGDDGARVGYAVALPGDRADCGTRPVWFAGSTLAYDLSLPRVREASALLGRAGRACGAGDVAALGDLLAVAAADSAALVRDRVRAAADAFEQAARARCPLAGGPRPRRMAGLHPRVGTRPPRAARGGGAAVVLTLLIALVEAAAAWHRAQEFRAQARAAAGAVLLREAAALTGTRQPGAGPRPRTAGATRVAGRGLPPALPVTGVPARSRPGEAPPERPGSSARIR